MARTSHLNKEPVIFPEINVMNPRAYWAVCVACTALFFFAGGLFATVGDREFPAQQEAPLEARIMAGPSQTSVGTTTMSVEVERTSGLPFLLFKPPRWTGSSSEKWPLMVRVGYGLGGRLLACSSACRAPALCPIPSNWWVSMAFDGRGGGSQCSYAAFVRVAVQGVPARGRRVRV